jgi:hypothetical protein
VRSTSFETRRLRVAVRLGCRRASRRASFTIVGLSVVLAALTPPAAGQQDRGDQLAIPLMVQTVPAVEGVRFALDGQSFFSDDYGLALITVTRPGIHQLEVFQREPRGGLHAEFRMWSDGSDEPARDITLKTFTFLEAGFDICDRIRFSFVTPDGTPVARSRIDSLILEDQDGNESPVNSETKYLCASRIEDEGGEMRIVDTSYRVRDVIVDGQNLVEGSQPLLQPGANGKLTIEIAAPARPDANQAPSPEAESPLLMLLLVAVAAVILLTVATAVVMARRRVTAGRAALHPELPQGSGRTTAVSDSEGYDITEVDQFVSSPHTNLQSEGTGYGSDAFDELADKISDTFGEAGESPQATRFKAGTDAQETVQRDADDTDEMREGRRREAERIAQHIMDDATGESNTKREIFKHKLNAEAADAKERLQWLTARERQLRDRLAAVEDIMSMLKSEIGAEERSHKTATKQRNDDNPAR